MQDPAAQRQEEQDIASAVKERVAVSQLRSVGGAAQQTGGVPAERPLTPACPSSPTSRHRAPAGGCRDRGELQAGGGAAEGTAPRPQRPVRRPPAAPPRLRAALRPPSKAPCHPPPPGQVLVYALFVAAYIVALFLQASAYDTGEVVATLRSLLLPGARLRVLRPAHRFLRGSAHGATCHWPPRAVRTSWRPTLPGAAPPARLGSLHLADPALRRGKRRAGAAERGWQHKGDRRPASINYHPSHLLQQ